MQAAKPRIRMIIPIWGEDYIERWLALSFAALRAEGNLPYLSQHSEFELALATKTGDAARMRADPRFARMTAGLRVVFVSIDEFFPPRDRVSYGVPLALAYGKAIADLGEAGLGSFVIIMTADMILSAGSLRSLFRRLEEGYEIVTGPSIRVVDAEVRPKLSARVDGEAGTLTISPRQMMGMVNAHLHNTVRARTVNEAEFIDSTYYHNIYWRVSPDCLAAHYFLLMPLCFRVQRQLSAVLCPIDYGFITEICPDGRFTVLNDSDDMVMLEMQERDSQAYLLRIAPSASSLEERLSRLEAEIAVTTGGWATAEHRRSAGRALYFHERDLPSDIAERTARFEVFMQNILAQMPPAPSHVRHFHWLGDVRNYRSHMVRGGATEPIALLDDPRNAVRPSGEELNTPSPWAGGAARRLVRYALEEAMLRSSRLRGWGRALAAKSGKERKSRGRTIGSILYSWEQKALKRYALHKSRHELTGLLAPRLKPISAPLTIACYSGIEDHLPALAGARCISLPAAPHMQENEFRLPAELSSGVGAGTLLIFAPVDLLKHWEKLGDDVAAPLESFESVIVTLMQPGLAAARMQDFAWVLSVLVGGLDPAQFAVRVDSAAFAAGRDTGAQLIRLLFPTFWLRLPGLLMRRAGALLRRGLSYPLTASDAGPDRFSVLLVEVNRQERERLAAAE
jgi:hypothetical protein